MLSQVAHSEYASEMGTFGHAWQRVYTRVRHQRLWRLRKRELAQEAVLVLRRAAERIDAQGTRFSSQFINCLVFQLK